jgi:formate dehydrogenase gamma subunit
MTRFLCLPALLITILVSPALGQSPDDCLICHSDRSLAMTRQGKPVSLFVDGEQFKNSSHAPFTCVGCHIGYIPTNLPHAKKLAPAPCQSCHETAGFDQSVHANAGCTSCHRPHEMVSVGDVKSVGAKKKQAELCLRCHLERQNVREQMGYAPGFMGSYPKSVHGKALAAGNQNAPSCSDCHGLHDSRKGSDPSARTSKGKIAETCAPCHSNIAKTYTGSVHGAARKKGIPDSPTCTDCHGEHDIYAAADPRSPVAAKNVSEQVCGKCHRSAEINSKYGLAQDRFESFADSYHGLAVKAGSVEAANCASCHGVHDIRSSSDPASSVNPVNLPKTCGRCHPGANQNFAKGAVHVAISNRASGGILYWIQAIYICLIVVVIGGMLLHNFLDFLARTRHRMAVRQGTIAEEHHGTRQYVRMNLAERIQHVILLGSFILLAVTGFMLRFPDAWWVRPIRQMSEGFFATRSLIHRIAGVAMIASSIYHLLYLLFTRRGRKIGTDMLPRWKDVRDVWTNVRYLLGISKQKPLFDRFGYQEKAEYWALIWGVIVMAGTGIILWFENYFIGLITKLGWDISRTVHYYEAILATASIVVWHFYFVIFNPDVYPMSTVWLTGKISEKDMAEEHPLELERIKAEVAQKN